MTHGEALQTAHHRFNYIENNYILTEAGIW